MHDLVEQLSKIGRWALLLAIVVALIQLILRGLGVDIEIPVITEMIDLVTRILSTLARAFDHLLNRGHPLN